MNRKYIAITIAALMAVGIAGCGKKEQPAETVTPTAAPTEAPTLTPTATPVPSAALPIYSFDGTNAEKAVTDYLANTYQRQDNSSVVIPHMNILKMEDREATLVVWGAFRVCEYTLKDSAMTLIGGYDADRRFTLDKNSNGTFTVADCVEVKDYSDETELANLCDGDNDLLEAFKDQNKHDIDISPLPSIRGNDFAYYGYDNNLMIQSGSDGTSSNIRVPRVIFSTSGAKKMYLNTDAYVRTAPDEQGHAYYMLLSGAEVNVTGMTETWARVNVENRTGYVAATALSDTAPSATPTPTLTPTPSPKPTEEPSNPTVAGTVSDLYSDHIIIEKGDETLQYFITADTYMTTEDIPEGSAVEITYYIDGNGQAIATDIVVVYIPDEYEVIEIDDSSDDSSIPEIDEGEEYEEVELEP